MKGAGQGIEDSVALAEILDQVEGVDDFAKATKQFERFRKSRVETILRYSKQSAERWTLEDGPVQQERDKVRQAVWNAKPIVWDEVEQNEFANPMTPAFIKWLNHYDVMHEVMALTDVFALRCISDCAIGTSISCKGTRPTGWHYTD